MSHLDKKLEVLVVTMNNDASLIEKSNLNAPFVIANQSNHTDQQVLDNGLIVSTQTKGVGINRNIALMYSKADYVLFADDDAIFIDDLEKQIIEAFNNTPKADVLIFNINTIGGSINRRSNTKVKRVKWYNSLNYGAARICINRQRLMEKNIWFSTLFGGGAKYSCGEDTIFLQDCLKKKLKVYTYPLTICSVDQTTSTWFTGYNEKYFYDKGVLLKMIFPKMYRLFILYYSYKYKTKDMSAKQIRKYCLKGAKSLKK